MRHRKTQYLGLITLLKSRENVSFTSEGNIEYNNNRCIIMYLAGLYLPLYQCSSKIKTFNISL
jgi:hypothetical protein